MGSSGDAVPATVRGRSRGRSTNGPIVRGFCPPCRVSTRAGKGQRAAFGGRKSCGTLPVLLGVGWRFRAPLHRLGQTQGSTSCNVWLLARCLSAWPQPRRRGCSVRRTGAGVAPPCACSQARLSAQQVCPVSGWGRMAPLPCNWRRWQPSTLTPALPGVLGVCSVFRPHPLAANHGAMVGTMASMASWLCAVPSLSSASRRSPSRAEAVRRMAWRPGGRVETEAVTVRWVGHTSSRPVSALGNHHGDPRPPGGVPLGVLSHLAAAPSPAFRPGWIRARPGVWPRASRMPS